jgi:hypothetical protein
MEKWYVIDEDILGIRVSEGKYWKSIELHNGIVIDTADQQSFSAVFVAMLSSKLTK